MIDHLSTYATDYLVTKNFYMRTFEALGYSLQFELVSEQDQDFPNQRLCAFGPNEKAVFWVIEIEQKVTPRHIAFSASSREKVQEFYRIGLECGGSDNGGPGLRPKYHEHYYGAFLIDPDGNDIEAVCHIAE
jgi:hypothetical protein